jgi:hypothetical protein
VGDLVTVDTQNLKDGWFRLWTRSEVARDPKDSYMPESHDKLWVNEVGVIIEISTDILHLVRILSPRGKTGWIAQGNLEIIQSIE